MKIKVKVRTCPSERIVPLVPSAKPNSRQQKTDRSDDSVGIVWLKSQPIEGKTNQELIKLLARYFQVPQKQIKIKSGRSTKNKLIEIDR